MTLLGAGAMNSPRYGPAGLLVEHRRFRIAIDGGPGAEPLGPVDAWLVTDARAELIREIRALAREKGVEPRVGVVRTVSLEIEPKRVVHTSHPTFGYRVRAEGRTVVWAPEFLEFPRWAVNADLMFADAAGWTRPIRFARGVGGHAAALDVVKEARRRGVTRLVLAHIGRRTIRAIDAGHELAFGEFGADRKVYWLLE